MYTLKHESKFKLFDQFQVPRIFTVTFKLKEFLPGGEHFCFVRYP